MVKGAVEFFENGRGSSRVVGVKFEKMVGGSSEVVGVIESGRGSKFRENGRGGQNKMVGGLNYGKSGRW